MFNLFGDYILAGFVIFLIWKFRKTIGLSYETRNMLKDLKIIPEETYDNVVQRIIELALKVPALEMRVQELEEKLENKEE